MDEMCVLGKVLILVIIGCVAFVVLAIPLFYTVITRWLTADGAPVIDAEGMVASGATVVADTVPVAAKTADPAKSVEAPVAAPVAVVAKKRDDLKALPGLLAEMEAKLNAAGIRRYGDLAALGESDIQDLGKRLSFRNQATWSAWKSAAGLLARDDLKVLPGLLAEMEAKLNHAGVSSFEKLASLSDGEVGAIGDAISFRNRATWNAWRAKAGELAG